MNFVAHQLLSFNNENLQIGNFLAETVRGKKYKLFPEEIAKGILLHRFIDNFTDNHFLVKELTQLFHPTQKKYSPIVIDVVFDYFLIQHWHKFSDENFVTFTQNTYDLIQRKWVLFPKDLQYMLQVMIHEDWFNNYSSLQGIEKSLSELGNITQFANNLKSSLPVIEQYYEEIESNFLHFFPEILQKSKSFVEEL